MLRSCGPMSRGLAGIALRTPCSVEVTLAWSLRVRCDPVLCTAGRTSRSPPWPRGSAPRWRWTRRAPRRPPRRRRCAGRSPPGCAAAPSAPRRVWTPRTRRPRRRRRPARRCRGRRRAAQAPRGRQRAPARSRTRARTKRGGCAACSAACGRRCAAAHGRPRAPAVMRGQRTWGGLAGPDGAKVGGARTEGAQPHQHSITGRL